MRVAPRKTDHCLNCGYPLQDDFNYCPRCSQENSNKLTSFGTLVFEVVSNFLSYDSRFVQTIFPFLFKPGFLTNEFIAGRRIQYTHPLRLYFFVSVIYFSLVSVFLLEKSPVSNKKSNASLSPAQADSLRALVKEKLAGELSPLQLQKIDSSLNVADTNQGIFEIELDDKPETQKNPVEKYISLIQKNGINEQQVLDSLNWENTYWNRFKAKQGIRLASMDKQEFIEYFLSKISLMMFVMLPFVTLFLKLLYVRRKRFYMEHLTFMLHIHAFMFFALSVALLWDHYQDSNNFLGWTILLVIIYITIAFHKVYRQGWIKTFTKMFILFIAYTCSLSIFLLLTLVVTAMLV